MKTIISFFIAFVCFSSTNYSQWTQQNSGTTNDFYSSFFLNENLGWAAGLDGTIHKTTNGGNNWDSYSLTTNDNVHTIFFVDPLHGWITMYEFDPIRHGSIYYTSDGGEHWTQQLTINNYCLLSVHFINQDLGWVVGTNGIAYKTTNSGLNWIESSLPTAEWLFFVFFINDQIGWVSGGMDWIYKTTNGGITWF
ncbi:MAG: YCF48-related protein, partial [Nitrososphaeraceae archaeon]|nr:YCF48-related protein [Nitrososphaeraceae archaeon]